MPYTINSHMPRIRKDAVALVERGWSTRKVSRHTGFSQSAIVKWCARSDKGGYGNISTRSSRPKHHPKQLSDELVWAIFRKRLTHKRCAEVVHQELRNEGIHVSLSSVKRTIDRMGLTKKRSPWKRYHPHVERPRAEKPGDLVQIDTIHTMQSEKKRMYTFVLIDAYSRWVYAKSYQRMNAATTQREPSQPEVPIPEIMPQLVPYPEAEKKPETPIDVINGAPEELRRKEKEDEGGEIQRKPTIH